MPEIFGIQFGSVDTLDKGEKQEPDHEELGGEAQVAAARRNIPFLQRMREGSLARHVKGRWESLDPDARKIQTQLKVNQLRFEGEQFAQVHPHDQNRVYMPGTAERRSPPTINKIRRGVHRYMAQVTADEPVLQGVPASHSDEARDAAEAATSALRGEWHRMTLHRHLQRATLIAGIMRSGFWFFDWDEAEGGKTPAQKFFTDENTGERVLHFVDSSGEKVEDPDDAAMIWEGNLVVETMTPFNVRWTGGNYVHEADEVFVAKLVTLGKLYEIDPSARDVRLSELIGHVPAKAEEWLHDVRGAGGFRSTRAGVDIDEIGSMTGRSVSSGDSLLDEPVMLLHYFKPKSKSYPDGFHALIAGNHLLHRGKLRFGAIPVAQFKVLDDPSGILGLSIVDLLRDPQELLDFVNTQVLRWLQSIKRRWFVPMGSTVNKRDLMNPTNTVITYNAQAGAPTPEQHGELPQSLNEWVDRFDEAFDDELAIHDTMQGKHVPGVSSGRHAEALRSGDETVLGLTRTQIEQGLVQAGKIILGAIKKEWSSERRVRYFDNRDYVETAFKNTDFGETNEVMLKKGTLLMLTPAQKLETLFGYAEMGVLTGQELRKLAPLADVAGVDITEDPHYRRARRQNNLFMKGPPEDLTRAREKFEREMKVLNRQVADIQEAMSLGVGEDPDEQSDINVALQVLQDDMQEVQGEWQAELALYAPTIEPWENVPDISQIHLEEHTAVLAQEKAQRFPEWWRQPFVEHTMAHMKALAPPEQEAPPGGAPPPGTPPQQQGGRAPPA